MAIKKPPMLVVPFGAAFPGMVISTTFAIFATVDFGVAWSTVNGNVGLAEAYFAAPLPVVGQIKVMLPFTMPGFLLMLVKDDVIGMLKSPSLAHALGLLQLATLGVITMVVGRVLMPAIQAVTKDGMTPEEATALFSATQLMFVLNAIMLISGVIKMYLSAIPLEQPAEPEPEAAGETKKTK